MGIYIIIILGDGMGTLDYYNSNAKNYFDTTVNADMSRAYNIFLKHVIEFFFTFKSVLLLLTCSYSL